jgi:LacI family transcriptional regulator
VADDLGYIPNQNARSLKGVRSQSVGVLTVNTNTSYYADLIGGLEHVLRERGYHCIVMDSVVDGEYLPERESVYVEYLLQHQVAAVVVTYQIAPENLAALERRGVDVVFVDTDRPASSARLYPCVNSDNYSGSFEMGMHLVGHGYPGPWVFVGFSKDRTARVPREGGFRDAAATAGIEVVTIEGGMDEASSYAAVSDWFDAQERADLASPRVIFAGNELLLQGTLHAVRDRGLRIPEDVAIVGYDDFKWAPYMSPPVTVVDQNVAQIGEDAGRVLLERLELREAGADPGPGRLSVWRTDLRVRLSCGCHRASDED